MKKLFSFFSMILIAGVINAQLIDTVRVRNLQLKCVDWLLELSYLRGSDDSATMYHTRRIITKLKATPNLNYGTDITIDSLPGSLVLGMYINNEKTQTGESRNVGARIFNAIKVIPQLQYFIGSIDAQFMGEYNRRVQVGKNMALDN